MKNGSRFAVLIQAFVIVVLGITNYQQGRSLDRSHKDFKKAIDHFNQLYEHFDTLNGAFKTCMGEK